MLTKDEKFELLEHSSNAKTGKRFFAFFIDFIFIFLLALGIFNIAYSIITSSNQYKDMQKTVGEEISYYEELIEETKLATYCKDENGTIYRDMDNTKFARYTISEMLIYSNENGWYDEILSANYAYKDELKPTISEEINYLFSLENPLDYLSLPIVASSYENDRLAYFYNTYLPAHNNNNNLVELNDITANEYYISRIKNTFGDNLDKFLQTSQNPDVFPYVIKKEVAKKIFLNQYIGKEADSDKHFETLVTLVNKLQIEAEDLLINSKEYYQPHYVKYANAYIGRYKMQGASALIGFAIAYLIYILVFKIIFKFESTPGRLILKLGVLSKEGEKTALWQTLVRSILGFFAFLPTIFFFILTYPFDLSSMPYAVPIFSIGTWELNIMLIIFILVGISVLNFALIAFSHYHNGVVELLSQTVVLDMHHIDEYDYDEKGEGAL